MSNVVGTYNCDHCGKLVEGVRGVSGGVVTRDGVKCPCSPECFIALAQRSDGCTLGELERLRQSPNN
jgi:hypothetical protein